MSDRVLSPVLIRRCEARDLSAVVAISNYYAEHTAANFSAEPEPESVWQTQWSETHQRYPWLVALAGDGTVVGFAKAAPWKGRCAYHWTAETTVYLRADSVGQGIGRRLYQRLFTWLRAQGFHSAIAGITLPNAASVALHEALGMRQVASLPQIGWKFGRWHDVGYWMVHFQNGEAPPGTILSVAEVCDRDLPNESILTGFTVGWGGGSAQ